MRQRTTPAHPAVHPSVTKKLNDNGRCLNCAMRLTLCLCDKIHPLTLETKILIIMHYRETKLFSGTAKLANNMLTNSQIFIRGADKEKATITSADLDPSHENLVLYPSENAKVLNEEFLSGIKKPICLIVPDGNWRQAFKVPKRESALKELQAVTLPPGPPSRYFLRTEPHLNFVCTYEAIARALGAIEGAEFQYKLETVFDIMVERVLWSRSKIRPENCKYPIPEAALLEAKLSGIQKKV